MRGNAEEVEETSPKALWKDKRGRITIPAYLWEVLGLRGEGWVEVEAVPDLENCKGIMIRKGD